MYFLYLKIISCESTYRVSFCNGSLFKIHIAIDAQTTSINKKTRFQAKWSMERTQWLTSQITLI